MLRNCKFLNYVYVIRNYVRVHVSYQFRIRPYVQLSGMNDKNAGGCEKRMSEVENIFLKLFLFKDDMK
jgi:hypothetical protein